MEGLIFIQGEIGVDFTLKDLIVEVEKNKKAKELNFVIDSVGGFVDEGFAIGRYIEQLPQKTISHGKKVYSIANIPFFASDERRKYEGGDFMLHNAWVGLASGNKEELRDIAEDLEKIDSQIRNYIALRTGLSDNVLSALMSRDTFISNEEAQSLGFFNKARALAFAAMATKEDLKNFKNKINNMSDNKKKLSLKEAFLVLGDALGLSSKNEAQPVNIDLELADGGTIFVETENSDVLEGMITDAPVGEHTLADGRVIVVSEVEGQTVITEVRQMEEEDTAMEDDKKMMEEENQALKDKIAELESKLAEKTEESSGALNRVKELEEREAEVINYAKQIQSHRDKFPEHPLLNVDGKTKAIRKGDGSSFTGGNYARRLMAEKAKRTKK